MKVFFNASVRGFQEYKNNYNKIAETLTELGCTHTYNPHFSPSAADNVYLLTENQIKDIHSAVSKSMYESDVVVLEVSLHSLTQGYILHKAIADKKPIIALHVPGKLPAFVMGIESDKLQVIEYTPETVAGLLAHALEYAKDKADTRFNLFLTQEMSNYLTESAAKENIPRSIFIRNLISKHQEENGEE